MKETKRNIWGFIVTRINYRNVKETSSCVHFTLKRCADICIVLYFLLVANIKISKGYTNT